MFLQCNFQCTDDDNRSCRNVCKMSFTSFSLAVIFIIRICWISLEVAEKSVKRFWHNKEAHLQFHTLF